MPKLANRARMTTATTGTGTLTLGAATPGFQSFADAGIADGDQVRYVIEDGAAWEIGLGTYGASGTVLSRLPQASANAGAAISLSGSAIVFVTAVADDIAQPADVQLFTTPGTASWTRPAGAKAVDVIVVGGGGGGGSGRKGASGTAAFGGGAGAGGGRAVLTLPAVALDATVSVSIGAGGAGGAAVTIDSTNGNNGIAGGQSSFGSFVFAPQGNAGAGGTTISGTGGTAVTRGLFPGTSGGAGSSAGGAIGATSGVGTGPAGGGGGGGLAAVPANAAGGAGGFAPFYPNAVAGTGGTAGGGTGSTGTSSPVNAGGPGAGGGGGGSSTTGSGGSGANGGLYGGGGGGGGGGPERAGHQWPGRQWRAGHRHRDHAFLTGVGARDAGLASAAVASIRVFAGPARKRECPSNVCTFGVGAFGR